MCASAIKENMVASQITIFKPKHIVIIFLTSITYAHFYDLDELDTLGDRISETVNTELAPLQNLGSRINTAVEEGLEPIRTGKYNRYVQRQQTYGLQNLGNQISSNVNAGLAPLNNLGSQIQQSVYEGLAPVRAMEMMFKMKDGIGGTTIVTHSPSGNKFIVKDRQVFHCKGGEISPSGQCSGKLVPFQINSKSDYCYVKNKYSIINDYICIGADSVSVINNNIRCESYNNAPVLVMRIDEFNNMCRNLSEKVEYKYIANTADPAHVKIPNENKYVKCSNNEPNICIFTEFQNFSTGRHVNFVNIGNTYSSNIVNY